MNTYILTVKLDNGEEINKNVVTDRTIRDVVHSVLSATNNLVLEGLGQPTLIIKSSHIVWINVTPT